MSPSMTEMEERIRDMAFASAETLPATFEVDG